MMPRHVQWRLDIINILLAYDNIDNVAESVLKCTHISEALACARRKNLYEKEADRET